MSKLYLLDMSGIAHWCYHAGNKDLRDPDGKPCGMLHKWREWIYEFMDRFDPQYIGAVFDGSRNWRKDPTRGGDVEYKAQRKEVDEDLKLQLNALPAEIAALGVCCLRYDEFEADDTIASVVARDAGEDMKVVVVSSDKDLAQLINDHVTMFDPRPDRNGQTHLYDAEAATKKWEVPPHRMAEWLALVGDTGDNVCGVEGWGKVRAVNAINQTRSWPELERKARRGELAKIKPELQASLIKQLDTYRACLKLVTLRYDVPLTETLDSLRYVHPVEAARGAA